MSDQVNTVVSGDESEIYDEPHIRYRRITVHYIHGLVEQGGPDAQTVQTALISPPRTSTTHWRTITTTSKRCGRLKNAIESFTKPQKKTRESSPGPRIYRNRSHAVSFLFDTDRYAYFRL